MTDENYFNDLDGGTIEVSIASEGGEIWIVSDTGGDDFSYLIFDRETARKIGERLLELTK